MTESTQIRVGRLGPYQLLRKIGRGSMAEVWSAKRESGVAGADKFVAIKLLAPHLAEQAAYRDLFLAEGRLSMTLSHSNIVHVFDVIDDPPHCYMVMELVEGVTLSQLQWGLAKRGLKIPLGVGAYVIGELLRALAHAHGISHDAGSVVIHRDVSPQNLMVTTAGEVKLMDFGVARFASEETRDNLIKGKLQYMSPEQLRKRTRKPTVDLFAVGCILHELIDGRRFRANIDQGRLVDMVIRGEVPALRTREPVPPELDELRLALLEPDDDHRIASAKQALQLLQSWPGYRHAGLELEALVQSLVERKPGMPDQESDAPLASDSESAMQQIEPRAAAETVQVGIVETDTSLDLPIGRTRGWQAAAACLLLAVLGGLALMSMRPTEDPPVESKPAAEVEVLTLEPEARR